MLYNIINREVITISYTDIRFLTIVVMPTLILILSLDKITKPRFSLRYPLITILAFVCYYKYASDDLPLFAVSILTNVLLGRIINFAKNERVRRITMITGVFLDIMLLAAVKIASFEAGSYIQILGLSFFTFKEISYLTDIYRRTAIPPKNIFYDALYLTFFAQIQSGPIGRYSEFTSADTFNKQLTTAERINFFTQGIQRIMIGLSKKIIIADILSKVTNNAFSIDSSELSMPFAWLGAICYSLELYFDFSGYTDMAIGLTNCFGFECPENFNYPYMSASVSEFWRRWHSTLGTWFREYVYIPMGGSRVGNARLFINLLTVWLLTGFWHGSNLSFVVWGLIHFVFIAAEKFSGIAKSEKRAVRAVWRVISLLAVIMAWVMFRADSVSAGLSYIKTMLDFTAVSNITKVVVCLKNYGLFIAAGILFSTPVIPKLKQKCSDGPRAAAVFEAASGVLVVAAFIIAISLLSNGSQNTFAYANF